MIDVVECSDEGTSILRVPIDRISAALEFGLQRVVGVVEAVIDDNDVGGIEILDDTLVEAGELPDVELVSRDAAFVQPGTVEFFLFFGRHRK